MNSSNKVYFVLSDPEGPGSTYDGMDIFVADSVEQAMKTMQAFNKSDTVIGTDTAEYGDCWLKTNSKPDIGEDGLHYAVSPQNPRDYGYGNTTEEYIPCRVSNPGTHPGGYGWWLSPAVEVLVPIIAPPLDVLQEEGDLISSALEGTCLLYDYYGKEFVVLADNSIITRDQDNEDGPGDAIFPY